MNIIDVEKELTESLEQELKLYAKSHLLPFTLHTMRDVQGNCLYEANWHHRVIAKYLDLFMDKKIKRLLLSAPPRHGKTELVSRRLPAMILGRYPDSSIICTSYSNDLASLLSSEVQEIIMSGYYKELFPGTRIGKELGKNSNTICTNALFQIVGRRGFYRACGIGGGISGMGADYAIIDDPIKDAEEAYSKTIKEKIWHWYQSTLRTRLEKDACVLLTLTRWFEDDLAGRLLGSIKKTGEEWTILNFPAIKEPVPHLAEEDTRDWHEALWPQKYDKDALTVIRKTNQKWWDAMYQGNPKMAGGAIIQLDWFKVYKTIPAGSEVVDITQFWDTAQKADEVKNAPWVCGTWVRTQKGYYLIDVYRTWHDYPGGLAAVKALYNKYKPHRVVIEDKSTGSTILQVLQQQTLIPCVPFLPKGDKEVRLHAESGAIEQGHVYLPEQAGWLNLFREEIGSLPNFPTKDQGDMLSMALRYYRENSVIGNLEELASFYESLPGVGGSFEDEFI